MRELRRADGHTHLDLVRHAVELRVELAPLLKVWVEPLQGLFGDSKVDRARQALCQLICRVHVDRLAAVLVAVDVQENEQIGHGHLPVCWTLDAGYYYRYGKRREILLIRRTAGFDQL